MRERKPAQVVRTSRFVGAARVNAEPPLVLATGCALYAIFFGALILLQPLSGRPYLAVSDLAGLVTPFFASVLCAVAGMSAQDHVRRGWLLIAAGCFAWGAGEAIWVYYEVILEQDPFPSLADVGYLAMLPLTALGLLSLTSERRKLASALPAIDGIVLVFVALASVWLFVLHPTYTQAAATPAEKAFSAAYPVGDLVLIYALAVAVGRRWGRKDALVLTTLLAGLVLLVLADVGFAYLTLEDRYTAQSVVNLGWPYGFICIGYAAALAAIWRLTYDAGETVPHSVDWFVTVALAGLMVTLLIAALRADALVVAVPLYVMVGIAGLAALARLAINLGLARELDRSREHMVALLQEFRRSAAG